MNKQRRLILFLVGTCLVLGVWHATFNAIRFHDSIFGVVGKATARGEEVTALYVADQHKVQHDKEDKPLFILHLGPPKTGTSTIQAFARQNRQMLREEDGVYYIGNVGVHNPQGYCTHELVRNCRLGSQTACRASWKELEAILEYHHNLNHTILVSEENLVHFDPHLEHDRLLRYLLPLTTKWNMHVVFTYRRHYEIVSSQYTELHYPATHDDLYNSWPGRRGGETLPSFANFTRTWEGLAYREPVATVKRWQERLGHVSIFNFHSDSAPLLQRFFCQAIPQAPRTCQYLLNDNHENQSRMQRNPSSAKHLHYDAIAVAAYTSGLIHNATLSRKDARRAVETHAKRLGFAKMTDFPLEHLSKQQSQALLSHSKRVEQTLVPDFVDETKVEAGFRHYIETGRLASVDPMAVLEDFRWQTFFSKL